MGIISSEDLLHRLHNLNQVIKDNDLIIYDPGNPLHTHGDIESIMMISSDVCALFPSMNRDETARVCSQMMEKSTLEVQNIDYREMLLYLRLNEDKVTNMGNLVNLLPVRKFEKGRKPGMTNEWITGPHKQSEIPGEKLIWIHRDTPLSIETKKRILAKAVEISIKTLFSGFTYTFAGKLFLQLDGAPIGTRIACACALLMMEWLWEEVAKKVRESDKSLGVKIWEWANFVDDARTWVNTLRKGVYFDGIKFVYSVEQEESDRELTREEVTFREFGKCLNSISEYLDFTFEKPSDFEDKSVPTLDFKISVDYPNNQYTHTSFEKSMNSKWVIPEDSAMDRTSKNQILANDMTRRLSRIDPNKLDHFATEAINAYDKKLIFSGYQLEDRRRIVEGGITAYMSKLKTCGEGNFYNSVEQTLAKRNQKKTDRKNNVVQGQDMETRGNCATKSGAKSREEKRTPGT